MLPADLPVPFVEYMSPRATIAPPYPSPLAAKLMNIDGITAVFYGADFITVTKAADANWAHVRPEIFALITEAITSGETIVSVVERDGAAPEEIDSLAYNEDDDEVVGMIKELLETRIRPAIQEDGGDIEFRGFEDGMVKLKLRGACRTCDSSAVTLKNGIEGMLMHYVSFFFFLSFGPLHCLLLLWCMAPTNERIVFTDYVGVYRLRKSRASNRSSTRKRRLLCPSLPSLRKSSSSKRHLPKAGVSIGNGCIIFL